ncbi:ATP-binding cassette domain-containing protein [Streptomyces sp. 3MP-14]|uniref:ATP-binding cassette domain-containing protein n=1 Tax=Streptomyces mimosae TaxID=2586635 RepID=A0A5N5ZZ06_9ACTN|nr:MULTISPECIES: ABC transporter ATP-binding protein [Streptomyces]KAB8161717.1 ATP-binding cassette domain-containing protein [Streptomyces mimosae]KAB8175015.1 ATP-binding cassette domain-containing protein [Streptomyces sp. 3MP-14]
MRESLRAYGWAWRVAGRSGWWRIAIVVLANLLLAVHGSATAVSLGFMVDGVANGDTARIVGGSVSAALLVALMFGAFSVMLPVQTTVTERSIHEVDQRLIRLAGGMGTIEPYENAGFADRLTTVRREPSAIISVVWSSVSSLSFLFGIAVAMTALAYIDPRLLLLPLAGIPVILATRAAGRIRNRAVDEAAITRRASDHLFSVLTDPDYGKEVRVFRSGGFLLGTHRAARREGNTLLSRADVTASVLVFAGWIFFGTAWGLALAMVASSAVSGSIGVGEVATVIAMANVIQNQVTGMSGLTRDLISGTGMVRRFLWLEDHARTARRPVPERGDAAGAGAAGAAGIVFTDVAYRYPDAEADALSGVNVFVPAGASVMVVGENGAGKSTFVRLLLGLCAPTGGSVAFRGLGAGAGAGAEPDSGAEPERGVLATAAFQDAARFELTLRESIGVGAVERASDEEAVRGALADSGARFTVEELDTQLGRRWGGRELSGGQWQQVAVARSFMRRDVGLLVFDEPNAGLDPIIEDRLYRRYMAAREHIVSELGISVLVTHRISPGVSADLVLVFHEGRLAEAGSHEELVERGGRYRELYELQVRAYR